MIPTFDCRCMITVFPICSFTTLSLIKLLSCPTCNQFNGIRNNITFIASNHEKMYMVRGDGIVQYHQTVTLLCFIQPLKPSSAIFRKFEQKLSLMTPVGDMPYLAWNIMFFALAIGGSWL